MCCIAKRNSAKILLFICVFLWGAVNSFEKESAGDISENVNSIWGVEKIFNISEQKIPKKEKFVTGEIKSGGNFIFRNLHENIFSAIGKRELSQIKTWTGQAGNNWSDAGNWNPEGMPGADDDVVINTNANIQINCASPVTINSLTVSNASVTLSATGSSKDLVIDNSGSSINSGATLILQGSSVTEKLNMKFTGSGQTFYVYGIMVMKANSVYDATNSVTEISGLFRNEGGSITSADINLFFKSGSEFNHNMNGGTIPTAKWDANSTLNITGMTSSPVNGFGQTFGNFIWNCASQTTDEGFPNSGFCVVGDMTLLNSNNKYLKLQQSEFNVQGNLYINNSILQISKATTLRTMNVYGDFNIESGNLYISDGLDCIGAMNIYGNFVCSGGAIYINNPTSQSGVLTLYKNFSMSGGSIYGTSDSHCSSSLIFAGTGNQTFLRTSGDIYNYIDITVNSGSILDAGTSVIVSAGKFNLSSGAGLITANADGIAKTGNTGTVQTTGTRSFSTEANYTYNGTAAQTTGNGLPSSVNELTIDNESGVTLTSSVTANGLLNLKNGAFKIEGKSLAINGSVNATSGKLSSNTSTSITIGGSGNAGTLVFSQDNANLNNFTMNQSQAGQVSFSQNVIISGTLTLTNGKIDMGGNTLTLGTSATSIGILSSENASSSSYIIGSFERWFKISTNSGALFPVGDAGGFRPVKITYTTAPTQGGKIKVSGYSTDPGTLNENESILDGEYNVNRYSKQAWWKIAATGISGGTYIITLGAYGISGVGNYQQLRILKREDGQHEWTLSGAHISGTGSNSEPTAGRSGITSGFSEFGIGGNSSDGNPLNDAPLPIVMKLFDYRVSEKNNVKLFWETMQEINNAGFEIERKSIGGKYSKIGHVEATGGGRYEFIDRDLQTGRYTYRLKQIDNNGNYVYFELKGDVIIGVPAKYYLSQNYPNPFNPKTKIHFDLPEAGNVAILLYDMLGRKAATIINEYHTAGYHTVEYDAAELSSGLYFYKMTAGKYTAVKKMVIIK